MNNSLIMMSTASSSAILATGIVPLNTITRRRGQVLEGNSNSIIMNRPGYYKVNANITFTAPVAGVVSVKAQKNNVDILGMTASTTITTATTEVRSLSISGVVRVTCGEGFGTLTLINSGVEITSSNVEIDVEYLG